MAEGMFYKIKGQSICELKRHWPNNPQEIPYLLIQGERYKKKEAVLLFIWQLGEMIDTTPVPVHQISS